MAAEKRPFFSVVIATRDRPDVDCAVRSALGQSFQDLEVVVVDDASRAPVVGSYPWTVDPRVRVARNTTSRGPSGARNRGIEESRGEYIAFLDDDDIFRPSKLARVRETIAQAPTVDVIYHAAYIRMTRERHTYLTHPVACRDTRELYRRLLVRNVVGGLPMLTVRRAACTAVGGFDEQLRSRVDYDFVIRLARAGFRFQCIDEPLSVCNYTTRRASVSKSVRNLVNAHQHMNRKFAVDMDTLLSDAQKRRRDAEIAASAAHSALLASDRRAAAFFLRAFLLRPRFRYVAATVASVLWPGLLLRIR